MEFHLMKLLIRQHAILANKEIGKKCHVIQSVSFVKFFCI